MLNSGAGVLPALHNLSKTMYNQEQKNELRKQIGAMLADARETKGWTRYRLSQETGIAEGHIMRIEKGLYSLRMDTFVVLCGALGIKTNFVFKKESGFIHCIFRKGTKR